MPVSLAICRQVATSPGSIRPNLSLTYITTKTVRQFCWRGGPTTTVSNGKVQTCNHSSTTLTGRDLLAPLALLIKYKNTMNMPTNSLHKWWLVTIGRRIFLSTVLCVKKKNLINIDSHLLARLASLLPKDGKVRAFCTEVQLPCVGAIIFEMKLRKKPVSLVRVPFPSICKHHSYDLPRKSVSTHKRCFDHSSCEQLTRKMLVTTSIK